MRPDVLDGVSELGKTLLLLEIMLLEHQSFFSVREKSRTFVGQVFLSIL